MRNPSLRLRVRASSRLLQVRGFWGSLPMCGWAGEGDALRGSADLARRVIAKVNMVESAFRLVTTLLTLLTKAPFMLSEPLLKGP